MASVVMYVPCTSTKWYITCFITFDIPLHFNVFDIFIPIKALHVDSSLVMQSIKHSEKSMILCDIRVLVKNVAIGIILSITQYCNVPYNEAKQCMICSVEMLNSQHHFRNKTSTSVHVYKEQKSTALYIC